MTAPPARAARAAPPRGGAALAAFARTVQYALLTLSIEP